MSEQKAGQGQRILLVEDSPVVSIRTEDTLETENFFVVGPAYDMNQALDLSQREQIDAAIVDLNIRGEKAFEVLEILEKRGIPFVITSGYADWSMPEEWQERPRLQKPFPDGKLVKALTALLNEKAS